MAHGVHDDAPTPFTLTLYEPVGQLAQEARPDNAAKDPESQAVHDAAFADENEPDEQIEQFQLPKPDEYNPDGHS